MSNIFSLSAKVIAITGGYGYLGVSISLGLINAGAQIIVLGKSKIKFDKHFSNIKEAYFVKCDVSSTESIRSAFSKIDKEWGKIDVLINNAFYAKGGDPDSMSDIAWDYTIDGVLSSIHRCIREVIPYFRKSKTGRIINVASMYGIVAPDFEVYKEFKQFTNPPHYGAAKAAVIQLTKYFASLLGKENILVNCVSPGAFPSKEVQKNVSFIHALSNKTPLERIGDPKELRGIFVFLASNAATYITGQNISVDGGWTIV